MEHPLIHQLQKENSGQRGYGNTNRKKTSSGSISPPPSPRRGSETWNSSSIVTVGVQLLDSYFKETVKRRIPVMARTRRWHDSVVASYPSDGLACQRHSVSRNAFSLMHACGAAVLRVTSCGDVGNYRNFTQGQRSISEETGEYRQMTSMRQIINTHCAMAISSGRMGVVLAAVVTMTTMKL